MRYALVAGWTSPIDFYLKSKGATPSGTMSGMTADLVLREKNTGALVTTTGDVSVQDTTNWIVRFSPDPSDLVEGIYRARFKVTDGSGLVAYFPSDDWDIWEIRGES